MDKVDLAKLFALTPAQASVPLNRRQGDYAFKAPVELPMVAEAPTTIWKPY